MQPIDLIRRDMPDAIRQLRAVHDWTDRDITDLREAVRRAMSVVDFGDVRFAIDTDLTNF